MPRRPDPAPFGSDPADFFGDYQDAFPPPVDEAVDNPPAPRGKHRRQVTRGQLFARLRARVYRR